MRQQKSTTKHWCAYCRSGSFILDKELQPLGVGQPGELFIGGPGLAIGYLNDIEMTRQRFITSPFSPGKRIYRSGDLACWLPGGRVQYLGRLDEQVKIRGNRIELGKLRMYCCSIRR